ncbi:3' terminal RNA ribose 2'-O-methyltransferase Hen1 [Nodosilinea sp. LEGE 06152]|uniref:3' terminal RNA ribose 2'-O-methyltransferase Hen1 n=1 Tax=Nodosilinea sp. LEGE 06152 TaxID=2777966 RepID=UPI00187F5AB5|nr:3' terminal RNA ribose 2'-O-methyltransferase Hen1 [Nodosilinea sp. LEGE 06152]MBE9159550.1 3' terminal RNA ribose 2'-O-methyltransferase Hen1 [Nodosilinea sp. LEGE 06152]
MLLTLTTTYGPATDLGYLLHKHPDRCQAFPMSFGQAFVFYPEAGAERCTAALMLDIDPVGLVRGKSTSLEQYVNDRPYVASSFLSVAIAKVFGTALAGQCNQRPELVATAIPLTVSLPVLPCRGGEAVLRQLFEPLGYEVTAQPLPLDDQFPDWGNSPYFAVNLHHTVRLADLLSHLYVLIPVLDDEKHYWVGDEEVEKLLRHGSGWLSHHPARETITRRYLKQQRQLTRLALEQLSEGDRPDPDAEEAPQAQAEEQLEQPISLNQQRMAAVVAALKASGAKRVVDLGCGEGKLLRSLLKDPGFEHIAGVDVSHRALERAQERLERGFFSPTQRSRLNLFQGSLTYRDERLSGFDAATVVEVIEHLDPDRLASLERVLFEFARPQVVIITTPNIEYNSRFAGLPAGTLRHSDHRFEWTRAEFQTWATQVAERFGYRVQFHGIGAEDLAVGTPTQMGVFER